MAAEEFPRKGEKRNVIQTKGYKKPSRALRAPLPTCGVEINVLEQMKGENSDISSPLFDSINLDKLVLIGHSMGGLVGLNAMALPEFPC